MDRHQGIYRLIPIGTLRSTVATDDFVNDSYSQSQRGSNPCLHLERELRVVQGVRLNR
jgi:hypothetical protein